MRRAVGLVVAVFVVFAVGPKVRIESVPPPLAIEGDPLEVAQQLAASEARIEDLREGTEAKVIWAGEPGARTSVVLLSLHGFSASRQETAPLSDHLAKKLQANLLYARLRGHGRPGAALAEVRGEHYLEDGHRFMAIARRLGDRVIVLGTSTGATVATWLATETEALAWVLISPNYRLADPAAQLLLLPWAEYWVPLAVGPERVWEPANEAQGRYWTTRYPIEALFGMMSLVELVGGLDPTNVRGPLLIVYSKQDPVVSAEATEAMFERMTSAEPRTLVEFPSPQNAHVLAGDVLSPKKTDEVLSIIGSFLRGLKR